MPINYYGKTKWEAEQIVSMLPNHLILRTDQIYGWARPQQKKSFVERIVEKLGRGEIAEVCKDWYNNPTYTYDLIKVIDALLQRKKIGVYHTVGNGFLNRYEWALEIAKVFEQDATRIVPILSSTLGLPARRPNCRLSNAKVQKETGITLRTVAEGLESMKKERGT